jgi:hypothetical protein
VLQDATLLDQTSTELLRACQRINELEGELSSLRAHLALCTLRDRGDLELESSGNDVGRNETNLSRSYRGSGSESMQYSIAAEQNQHESARSGGHSLSKQHSIRLSRCVLRYIDQSLWCDIILAFVFLHVADICKPSIIYRYKACRASSSIELPQAGSADGGLPHHFTQAHDLRHQAVSNLRTNLSAEHASQVEAIAAYERRSVTRTVQLQSTCPRAGSLTARANASFNANRSS